MKHTPIRTLPKREDYRAANGLASWWEKDGAWHIAYPEVPGGPLLWTANAYDTRDEAIAALAKVQG